MARLLGQLSSGVVGWSIAAVLLAILVLTLTGAIHGTSSIFGGGSYTEMQERLAGADRSQPLRMRLEAAYPGPLQDTTIERWRDPVDGTVCYIYLPIAVAHAQGPAGLVQYGSAAVGTISCFPQKP